MQGPAQIPVQYSPDPLYVLMEKRFTKPELGPESLDVSLVHVHTLRTKG